MNIKNLNPYEITLKDQYGNTVLYLPAGPEDAEVPEPEEGVICVVDPVTYYVKYEMREDLTTRGRLLSAQIRLEKWTEENPAQDPGSKTLFDFLGDLA